MYTPNAKDLALLERLQAAFLAALPPAWWDDQTPLADPDNGFAVCRLREKTHSDYERAIGALEVALGTAEFETAMMATFFHPATILNPMGGKISWRLRRILHQLAKYWMLSRGDIALSEGGYLDYWDATNTEIWRFALDRWCYMISDQSQDVEPQSSKDLRGMVYRDDPPDVRFAFPGFTLCGEWVLLAPDVSKTMPFLEFIVYGDPRPLAEALGKEPDEIGPFRKWLTLIRPLHILAVVRLVEADALDVRRFENLLDQVPDLLRPFPMHDTSWAPYRTRLIAMFAPARAVFEQYLNARLMPLSKLNVMRFWKFARFRGARYFLAAADYINRSDVKTIAWCAYPLRLGEDDGADATLREMVAASRHVDDPEDEEILSSLRALKPSTLWAMLPYVSAFKVLVAEAMGNAALAEVAENVLDVADRIYLVNDRSTRDCPNCHDAAAGRFYVTHWRNLFELLPGRDLDKLLSVIKATGRPFTNTQMLIQAMRGRGAEKLPKMLDKRSQVALKAFALQPLTRGSEEAQERYQRIREFEKGIARYGQMRQANEKAAAQTAIANLAENLGFTSPMRFVWAMEAQLSDKLKLPTSHTAGDYSIHLDLDAEGPVLTIKKQGKSLKSIPKAVKTEPFYQECLEAIDELKDQARRYRLELEQMMASGSVLAREDLAELMKAPVTRSMLATLVLRDVESPVYGMIEPDAMEFSNHAGVTNQMPASLRIAHVYDLVTDSQQTNWQRRIVTERMVQPFKQVFREVYTPTKAELEDGNYSYRFAGHKLVSHVVGALLARRGWEVATGNFVSAYRRFPDANVKAVFSLDSVGAYLTAGRTIETDHVSFIPLEGCLLYETRIPLDAVPPLIFSETMRDIDLFCAVSSSTEDLSASSERIAANRELVRHLITAMGLTNIEVSGHFAHIKGTRAGYRVHLASGAVQLEPGGARCEMPDTWNVGDDFLYLSVVLAAEEDVTTVVSRILRLANDSTIKDASFLAQIEANRQ